jgi:hypothetical protein
MRIHARAGAMAQVAESLPNKYEALNSNSIPQKKKKKETI